MVNSPLIKLKYPKAYKGFWSHIQTKYIIILTFMKFFIQFHSRIIANTYIIIANIVCQGFFCIIIGKQKRPSLRKPFYKVTILILQLHQLLLI